MHIIIDADACPRSVKEILYRAAQRVKAPLTVVANSHIRTPQDPLFRSVSVPGGFDAADDRIVEMVETGDLVITADIPLADRVVKKGAHALDPRGERYTAENIGSRLSVRDFMQGLRDSGVDTGGPPPLTPKDCERFANALTSLLAEIRGPV
jgi:hypothetical protein